VYGVLWKKDMIRHVHEGVGKAHLLLWFGRASLMIKGPYPYLGTRNGATEDAG
jgi:hypothetical protein